MKYSPYYEYIPGVGCVKPDDIMPMDMIRENVPIWACAYETTRTKENMSLKCLPTRGIISDGKFIPYKKNGELKMSGKVGWYARSYADTYEECVDLYNFLVNKHIKSLEALLAETRSHLIEK